MDVADWLQALGLELYEAAFRENDVHAELLPDLTADDLKDLGITSIGHRRVLLKAIAALHRESRSAADPAGLSITPTETLGLSAERRPLSVMFCDLVDSTALSARLDPEDLRDVIRAYQTHVAATIQQFDGFIARYVGDGILIYFGWPEARETDAERAVRAGLAVAAAVSAAPVSGESLQVRVGIATGLVIIGDPIGSGDSRQQTAVGETPNLAARLQGLADPGQVVIDAATRRQTGRLFECQDLGMVELKGLPMAVPAWQVLAEGMLTSRFEALRGGSLIPLIGRVEELELLLRGWKQAASGEGRVVLLTGEAGIGKSRIAVALEEHLYLEPHLRFRYFCSPHHRDSPLYPFVSQIERAAGFSRDDASTERLDKLAALLLQSGERFLDDVPLFADLLTLPTGGRYRPVTLDPQRRREQIFASLIDQLEALACKMPVQVIFEDAHWADSTSLELIQMVVERVAHLPVLLVITFRPEFVPPWTGHANVSTMKLTRLETNDAATLVDRVAGGKAVPREIVDGIVERADGIPLFIEELTKTLLESSILQEESDRYVLVGQLPSLSIPPSLHASLIARLDRLNSVKEVAQIGATIGREFSYELLAMVTSIQDDQLQDALDQLIGAGLVFPLGATSRAAFIFKHALVQDAAYNTLLRAQRLELHAKIGKTLEAHFRETVDTQPEIIAHHYTQAGLLHEAIVYWHKAGELALRRSANIEAATHLNRGIELTHLLPPGPERDRRELRLYLSLGPTMRAIRGSAAPELLEVYSRARDLMTEDASIREQMNVLYGLWIIHFVRSEHEAAYTLARDCIARSMQHQKTDFPVLAHSLMGNALWAKGLFCEARTQLNRSLALCASEHLSTGSSRHAHNHSVAALSFLGFTLWPLGYPQQAAAAAAQAVARADSTGHVPLMAMALHNQAFLVAAFAADPQLIGFDPKGAVDYCVEHGVAAYEPWARFSVGAVLARCGEPLQGIEIMQDAMEAAQKVSTKMFRAVQLGLVATAHARLGRPETADVLLRDALGIVHETDERFFESELYRLHGEILAALGDTEKAEEAFLRALTIARKQGARLWELRAASSFSQLLIGRGRKAKARQLLAPVYNWFTEGINTADLTAARLLLEGLTAVA